MKRHKKSFRDHFTFLLSFRTTAVVRIMQFSIGYSQTLKISFSTGTFFISSCNFSIQFSLSHLALSFFGLPRRLKSFNDSFHLNYGTQSVCWIEKRFNQIFEPAMWPRKCLSNKSCVFDSTEIFVRNSIQKTTWSNDHLTTLEASTSNMEACLHIEWWRLSGQLEGRKKCSVFSFTHVFLGAHRELNNFPMESTIKKTFAKKFFVCTLKAESFNLFRFQVRTWLGDDDSVNKF